MLIEIHRYCDFSSSILGLPRTARASEWKIAPILRFFAFYLSVLNDLSTSFVTIVRFLYGSVAKSIS